VTNNNDAPRKPEIHVHRSSSTVPVILVIFQLNLNFLECFFEESSNIKFQENSSSGILVVPWRQTDGQMDGHDLVDGNFSQFSERA